MIYTFQYAGPSDSLFVETAAGNVELKKDAKFTTDDDAVARRLRELPDVEEEKEAKEPKEAREEAKKPFAKARDGQS